RRSSEDRFINKIAETYGADAVLAYGDWSSWTGKKGLASSPITGFRNRLAKKFTVVVVPEQNTTQICSRCGKKLQPDDTRTRLSKNEDEVSVRGIRRCYSDICGDLR